MNYAGPGSTRFASARFTRNERRASRSIPMAISTASGALLMGAAPRVTWRFVIRSHFERHYLAWVKLSPRGRNGSALDGLPNRSRIQSRRFAANGPNDWRTMEACARVSPPRGAGSRRRFNGSPRAAISDGRTGGLSSSTLSARSFDRGRRTIFGGECFARMPLCRGARMFYRAPRKSGFPRVNRTRSGFSTQG